MTPDEKRQMAEAASEACGHPIVAETIVEYAANMGITGGLPLYGLHKVAAVAAQVARAEALGIDPNDLLLDAEERAAAALAFTEQAVAQGVPVIAVDPDAGEIRIARGPLPPGQGAN